MDLNKLTSEEKNQMVESVIGIHPKYLLFVGSKIKVNSEKLHVDGLTVSGCTDSKFIVRKEF